MLRHIKIVLRNELSELPIINCLNFESTDSQGNKLTAVRSASLELVENKIRPNRWVF